MNSEIKKIHAREIIDSRGNPTIEVEVYVQGGYGKAAAPSGASTGIHEAIELRDGGKRFRGKGVRKAVENVNKTIGPALKGMDAADLKAIDEIMIALDGTPNKEKLGANATVATSMACVRAAAWSSGKHVYALLNPKANVLPVPFMNVINGGKHAGNGLAVQEFMIAPTGFPGFSEALEAGCNTYHALKEVLREKYGPNAINVGDEGGFAPNFTNTTEAVDALMSAVEKAGYMGRIQFGMDAAASSFYDEEKNAYHVDGKDLAAGELLDYYKELAKTYPIASIEDPFHEEAFEDFARLTKEIGSRIQVVGDDLLVTNTNRIKTALSHKSVNALLLKVNQIGTVSESIQAAELSFKNDWSVMVSHRSGETGDTFIADFAVALECGQIKTGAPARAERTEKYNQLLRIEEELGGKAVYAGKNFRKKQ